MCMQVQEIASPELKSLVTTHFGDTEMVASKVTVAMTAKDRTKPVMVSNMSVSVCHKPSSKHLIAFDITEIFS